MPTAVTSDIRVSVEARFEPEHSALQQERYLFSYRINIANHGQRTVQLLDRHWHIIDPLAPEREVKGAGVVGLTPVIEPGKDFSYSSFCDLTSSMGRMYGSYTMRHIDDGSTFRVAIPSFALLCPYGSN